MGQVMWGTKNECYWVTVPKCSRREGTAEPDVRILKVNVRGCDWEMQLIHGGNNYMPVLKIYLKGPCYFDEQVPAHMKNKYPT
jgi:hypothetical protein